MKLYFSRPKIEYSNKDLINLIDPKFAHLKCDDKEQIVYNIQEKNKRIYLWRENITLFNGFKIFY